MVYPGITQSFFEIIDYHYRFGTERFIVPITVNGNIPVTYC